MSKKSTIVELLQKDTDVDDICKELEVSSSYVYRIKREVEELNGDKEDSDEAESDNPDNLVIDSSSGTGDNVEGNNEDLAKKTTKGKTDTNNGVGGVKKRKKRTKKVVQKDKDTEQNSTEHNTEHGSVSQWFKKIWKKMLLVLMSLILLVIMMSQLSRKKELPSQEITPQSRFPTLK